MTDIFKMESLSYDITGLNNDLSIEYSPKYSITPFVTLSPPSCVNLISPTRITSLYSIVKN